MKLRRALMVSGSLGRGHDAVAGACGAALQARGVQWQMIDAMALLGRRPGAAGERVFRMLLSIPGAYDGFHFSQLRDGGALGEAMERAAVAKMRGALRREIAAFDPDVVFPVFSTGAGALARLKAEGLEMPSVVLMTDSFAHRMWVHEGTDLFLVTSAMAAESVRRYRPDARVEVVAVPVAPAFGSAPSRPEARRRLGVPADVPCVVLMAGAWGLGPLDEAARALASEGIWTLVVAGSNAALEASLATVAAAHPEVIAFGFTDRIAELMSAADVVITTSGDTCREARSLGRLILLLDVVPGHGRENLMHELELGGAAACLPTARSMVGSVRSLLADPPRLKAAPSTGRADTGAQLVSALRRFGFEI